MAESALPKPMSVSALTLPTKGNQGKETSLKMRATGEGILDEVAWVLKLTENLAMKTQEESYFRRKKNKQKSPNTFTNTLSSQLQQAPEESLHLLTTAVTVAWAPIDMVTPLHLVLL